ncbi:hypothetical protein FHS27_001321 [Rhodopirellula rubra]|uniref:SIR2-like domain-containing protein n=1 Tax=Aporhodopirellula rubra TaxID=980271 RepID=A0A7W5H568_9BACT|nr:SIR2 family protein [Aporhodopirellula rubra]MBB3205521.1 hypothetical protein [Aporhodopirellula rubra]
MMWFLGAGASAASNIPTAWDMIWDFKRSIYCSANRVPISACDNVADPSTKRRIQDFCDSLPDSPKEDSTEEYSHYFKKAHPKESIRRKYIERLVSNGVPSFGYLSLASLMKLGDAPIIWTTNFDRMLEDAVARVYGSTSKLTVASRGSNVDPNRALAESNFPLYVKLHGDFQSQDLNNTEEELLSQDENMMHCMSTATRSRGMVVVGYSGRDKSVMDGFRASLHAGKGFPNGLFWIHRPGREPLPEVTSFISEANAAGVDANIVLADTFDEFTSDVLGQMPNVPQETKDLLEQRPRRISNHRPGTVNGSWPVIRTNAFPVIKFPSVCRKVVCEIGGYSEIREAVETAGVDVLCGRNRSGVLAFGEDDDIRAAFGGHSISEFSLHNIEPRKLRGGQSAEFGLLYDAIGKALVRQCPLDFADTKAKRTLVVRSGMVNDAVFDLLRKETRALAGQVPGTPYKFREAIRLRLDYQRDRLWLLIEPTVRVMGDLSLADRQMAKDFIRDRLARRYNDRWNALLDAWAFILFGKNKTCEFASYDCSSGVDACFEISRTSGFSWRGGVR